MSLYVKSLDDKFKYRCWRYDFGYDIDLEYDETPLMEYVATWGNLEKSTGVRDKKDNIVFDNDILRITSSSYESELDNQICHVSVDEFDCRWVNFKNKKMSWNEFCSLIDNDLSLSIEIIGNSNENPDLLESLKNETLK